MLGVRSCLLVTVACSSQLLGVRRCLVFAGGPGREPTGSAAAGYRGPGGDPDGNQLESLQLLTAAQAGAQAETRVKRVQKAAALQRKFF